MSGPVRRGTRWGAPWRARRSLPLAVSLTAMLALVLTSAPAPAAGTPGVQRAQRRLAALGCSPGPVDGRLGPRTRSAVLRFQSRTGRPQSGRLAPATRDHLFARNAPRCDRRPVPARTGAGRRIVVSQRQNWVWLVGPRGGVVAQGGIVDNPSVLSPGRWGTGSYCGRTARIRRNTTTSGQVWLENFVRFAPCGVGFHRIPTYRSTGAQLHPDWLLGTNLAESHGCIRLSRPMSRKVWDFTAVRTPVRVV